MMDPAPFPDCGPSPLGIYPIVDRADKLVPLYEAGITTAQLRVKDLTGAALKAEALQATALSRTFGARLFLNDAWQLALQIDAYGVHLGQEDIRRADVDALRRAGIRLGISTHTPEEIAFAVAYRPSYLAIGPIYEPIAKPVAYDPVGLQRLKAWSASLATPIVAIGGITEETITGVIDTGVADGIAMISAVLDRNGAIAPKRVRALIHAWNRRTYADPDRSDRRRI